MLHARLFAEKPSYRAASLLPPPETSEPTIKASYDGDRTTDRPLIIQFCANDPEFLLAAAKIAQDQCDAIDLNLGCPQGIARKGNYGAFLQETPDLIYNLINTLHLELDIPVTAKMRVLETREKTLEYAKMVLSAGASILTVHGRRREQKGHNTGLADWNMIRYLRENLPPETVLFANGNILYNTDIEACLEATGADGVMSAEANLHNPAIFMPPSSSFDERFPRVDVVCRDYLDIVHSVVFGNGQEIVKLTQAATSQNASLIAFKSHMFRLLHAVFAVKENQYIRELLAKSTGRDFSTYVRVVEEVEKIVAVQLLKTPEIKENWDQIMEGSGGVGDSVRVLSIPWWRCQPFIRPSPEEALKKGALKESKKVRAAKEQKRPLDIQQDEAVIAEEGRKKLKTECEASLIERNEQSSEIDIKVAG